MSARGEFEAEMTPLAPCNASPDAGLGRFPIDKRFHGDLEAASRAEMLSAGSLQRDEAGYVAIESVTGALHGRRGSFALQHSGSMHDGEATLRVSVVPGTGKGELAGLGGAMKLVIADDRRGYEFEYALPG